MRFDCFSQGLAIVGDLSLVMYAILCGSRYYGYATPFSSLFLSTPREALAAAIPTGADCESCRDLLAEARFRLI